MDLIQSFVYIEGGSFKVYVSDPPELKGEFAFDTEDEALAMKQAFDRMNDAFADPPQGITRDRKKFRVRSQKDGKRVNLGSFDTIAEALKALRSQG